MVLIGDGFWYGDYAVNKDSLPAYFGSLKAIGFDYIEVALDYPLDSVLPEIADAAQTAGLGMAFHAPWGDIPSASPLPEMRELAVRLLKNHLDSVSAYSPLYFNMHLISHEPTIGKGFRNVDARVYQSAVITAKDLLAHSAAPVFFENNSKTIFARFDEFLQLPEGSRFNVDTGHCGRAYGADYMLGMKRAFSLLAGRIGLVHIHDFTIEPSRHHLPLGSGVMDVPAVLSMVRQAEPEFACLETRQTDGVVSEHLSKDFNIVRGAIR